MGKQHCPILEKGDWDGKEFVWKNKPFYKTKYKEFMHMPLNFGKVLSRALDKMQNAGVESEGFCLSGEEGTFSSSLLIPIKDGKSGLEQEKISGTFLTKIFEGQYKEAGDWAKEMVNYVHGKQKEVKKLWFWYATCPKCAKEIKKVQTVIFAELV
jgi:hypothetical protein